MADAAVIPAGYLALAVAASWPLARDFATYTVGDVHYDERHAIWMLWYTAQALAGRVSWPDTTHLLWPHGISVLVDGVGPLNGVLALPFWPWGAAAAFNGTALLGIALSGWSLYALARGIGLARGPAFVAGALFLLWPIHLIAITGHLEKLFVGMLPLTLLAGLRAFDPGRGRAWLAVPGVALLGALLQNGNQFIFAALGVAFVGVQTWLAAPVEERRPRLRRMLIAGALSLVICAPLLLAIVKVMRDETLFVALGEHTRYYSPDALSLVLPAPHQRWAAWLFPSDMHLKNYVWAPTLPALGPTEDWYGTGLETAVDDSADGDRVVRAGVAGTHRTAVGDLRPGVRGAVPGAAPAARRRDVADRDALRRAAAPARPRRDADARPLHDAGQHRLRARRGRRTLRADAAPPVSGRGAPDRRRAGDRRRNAGRARSRRPRCRGCRTSTARSRPARGRPDRSSICRTAGTTAAIARRPTCTTRRSTTSRSRGRTCRATTSGFRTRDSIRCGISDCRRTPRSGPG